MLASYTSKMITNCIQPDIHPAPQLAKLQSKDSQPSPIPQQAEEVEKAMNIPLFLKPEKILTGICISQTIKNYRVRNLLSWQKRLESQYI